MKYSYDFHIHSALSPCAENEMTPNNILNMAIVKGLDVIAVTDHNAVGNLPAFENCAKEKPVLFVPGVEVESSEEVHISCLFPDVQAAMEMGSFIRENMYPVKNSENVLGTQCIFDELDNLIGTEEQMLLFPTKLPSDEIFRMARAIGGCAYFSHVERTSYSVLSVLGAFPENIGTGVVELTNNQVGHDFFRHRSELKEMTVLYSSDAHRLGSMSNRENYIDLPVEREKMKASDVISWIRDKDRG